MSTTQAEAEARQFLDRTSSATARRDLEATYERALRKAAASFDRLHEAAKLAERNAQSKS
jgi:hypothetical protein